MLSEPIPKAFLNNKNKIALNAIKIKKDLKILKNNNIKRLYNVFLNNNY